MKPWLQAAMFRAPWWALALNPYFLPRRALYRAMAQASRALRGRVLDVGCGLQPYRELMPPETQVVGLELPSTRAGADHRADVLYDGRRLPFPDGVFDAIMCNQVLEHVLEPRAFLVELRRVSVADAPLVLSVPFMWPEHEQPADHQRYTSFGLRILMDGALWHVVEQHKLVGGGAALLALWANAITARVRGWPLPLRLLARALVVAPFNAAGALLPSPTDADTYLDNFVVARKLDGR